VDCSATARALGPPVRNTLNPEEPAADQGVLLRPDRQHHRGERAQRARLCQAVPGALLTPAFPWHHFTGWPPSCLFFTRITPRFVSLVPHPSPMIKEAFVCPLPTLLCRCSSSLSAFPTLGDAQPLETLLQAATIETARGSITTYAERFTSCMLTALATSEQGALIGHQLFGACLPAHFGSDILRWSTCMLWPLLSVRNLLSGTCKSSRVIVCCLPPAQPAASPTACLSFMCQLSVLRR